MGTYFIMSDSDYLMHHGVKGQKWGVRRYQNPDGTWKDAGKLHRNSDGSYSMTKKEAKRRIREAKRNYRKATGGFFTGKWNTVGKNVHELDKKKSKAIETDEQLKAINKKLLKTQAGIDRVSNLKSSKDMSKDYMQRLQSDETASSQQRRQAEQRYLKDKEAYDKASKRYDKLFADRDTLQSQYDTRYNEITKSYVEAYKKAAVKDLGFDDIKAGMQLLESYGLMRKATGRRS